jgi:aerobic carbon-monoxide dehydrogenase medium subunit
VKPPRFGYVAPSTVDEALEAIAEEPETASVLAGGQSLVPMLNMRMAAPRVVVDLNGVAGLDDVTVDRDRVRLGAMVRQRVLETDARVAERLPLLAEATTHIAHVPIRTRGTLGGSLAHADPSAELPATIAALGGILRLRSAAGERTVAATDFFLGPLMTAIEPGELIVGIEIEPPPAGSGWAFREVARTHGAFALAGVATVLHLDAEGVIDHAALALCGVGGAPYLATWLGEMAAGERPGDALFEQVARRVHDEVAPYDDGHATADYRKRVALTLTERALRAAAERSNGRARA